MKIIIVSFLLLLFCTNCIAEDKWKIIKPKILNQNSCKMQDKFFKLFNFSFFVSSICTNDTLSIGIQQLMKQYAPNFKNGNLLEDGYIIEYYYDGKNFRKKVMVL